MRWLDCRELWEYWRVNPPADVSLQCLAIGMGYMKVPSTVSEMDESEMDRLLGE